MEPARPCDDQAPDPSPRPSTRFFVKFSSTKHPAKSAQQAPRYISVSIPDTLRL